MESEELSQGGNLESRAACVLKHLSGAELERTRDAIQLNWGGRAGIVVLVTQEAIEIRLPTWEWVGPDEPVETSKLWRRVEAKNLSRVDLVNLIKRGKRARARQYRACSVCGGKTPPEYRHGSVCHGCAEKEFGIVH